MTQEHGYLRIEEPDQPVRVVALAGDWMEFGSNPSNTVVLRGAQVQDYHAQIRIDQHDVVLDSLGAGITVNAVPLPEGEGRLLHPSDVIYISDIRITYFPIGHRIAKHDIEERYPPPTAQRWPTILAGARPSRTPFEAPEPSTYLRYLPAIFQDQNLQQASYVDGEAHSFLGRYLRIFETIWEPLEQRQDAIDLYFNPAACPERFIAWLASWYGIVLDDRMPEERRRQLVAELFELYRWRGTHYGLRRLLEICTGVLPEIQETVDAREQSDPQRFVFRVIMSLPKDAAVTAEWIRELIDRHKPAHAGYVLDIS